MGEIKKILDFLNDEKGVDFNGYRMSMLERRIQKRILQTSNTDYKDYYSYLKINKEELDKLLRTLTINVSSFFRDPLVFEYLSNVVIPELIQNKINDNLNDLRIWSAGSSAGQETYSLAIIINEYIEKEKLPINCKIFGTDIDEFSLNNAINGVYSESDLHSVKFAIFKKYFQRSENQYVIDPVIREMVSFSMDNLLNERTKSPVESIFGGFDMVFCRNVLIYMNAETQSKVIKKLYRSMNENAFLVLGESEVIPHHFQTRINREVNFCKIYKKSDQ